MRSDVRVIAFCLLSCIALATVFFLVDRNSLADDKTAAGNTTDTIAKLKSDESFADSEGPEVNLQPIDPNTADSTLLMQLGLSRRVVSNIYRYRSRGGVFYEPEDFARIYGITKGQYRRLRPYIRISDDYRPAAELVGPASRKRQETSSDTTRYPRKMSRDERLSVNDADTAALKRVPGIGSYYAKRIVDLRSRLGGFVSLDQLLEIDGFPEKALPYLTVPDGGIVKINVNTADFTRLNRHPYIGYRRAKAILDYRRLKGRIKSLSQLSLMEGFSEKELERLEPYVEY